MNTQTLQKSPNFHCARNRDIAFHQMLSAFMFMEISFHSRAIWTKAKKWKRLSEKSGSVCSVYTVSASIRCADSWSIYFIIMQINFLRHVERAPFADVQIEVKAFMLLEWKCWQSVVSSRCKLYLNSFHTWRQKLHRIIYHFLETIRRRQKTNFLDAKTLPRFERFSED